MKINVDSNSAKWWGAVVALQFIVFLLFACMFNANGTWKKRGIKTYQEPYVVQKLDDGDVYYISEGESWTEASICLGLGLSILAGVFCGLKLVPKETLRSGRTTLLKILRWPKG